MDRKEEVLTNLSGTETNLKNTNSKSTVLEKRKLVPKYKDIIYNFINKYDGYRDWRRRGRPVPPYPGYSKNMEKNPTPGRDLAVLPPGINGAGAFR